MNHMNRLVYLFIFSVAMLGFLGASLTVAQASSTQTHIDTTVFLTARVQDRWSYDGKLSCESATLETEGQIYNGMIRPGSWRGADNNESCFIAFENVPTPLNLTPARITVKFNTQVGADQPQVQEKDYVQELASYDDHVVLDDMILGGVSAGTTGALNNAVTPTTVSLTARVLNKWWVGGTLHCESATLETLGKTYAGAIQTVNAQTLSGDDACLIVFSDVLLPLGATPGKVTVRYYPLLGDELIEQVTADRKQTQSNDYLLKKAGVNDQVKLDDMILKDHSTAPVIEVDPNDTILPTLPDPSQIIPGL